MLENVKKKLSELIDGKLALNKNHDFRYKQQQLVQEVII